jgi:hypothetical protein
VRAWLVLRDPTVDLDASDIEVYAAGGELVESGPHLLHHRDGCQFSLASAT